MAQEFIYQMQGLRKVAPNGKEIVKDIWLSFFPGAKIGVIGPNGAGKSTILRIMAGVDKEYDGETWIDPKAKVGYLPQEPQLDPTLTVRENIELGLSEIRGLLRRYDEINAAWGDVSDDDQMAALMQEQGEVQDRIEALNAWELDHRVEIAMDALRVPDPDADVTHLSGGERRRVALCQLLLAEPDLLLLDEPTNHLDAETVAWLEKTLRDYKGTVIIVTHDRYFLDNVTAWILELENGKGIPFEGNYSQWLRQKQERLRQKDKEASALFTALKREMEWSQLANAARMERSKERLRAYEQLLSRAESNNTRTEFGIPPGPRLGNVVVELDKVSKGYGDRLLIDNLSFKLPRGGIVGVIGPNGAGKTTLFRMLTGQEQPDGGQITVGETVRISSVEQLRSTLKDDKSVWENITGGAEVIAAGKREINSRAYVSAFGFKGTSQQQPVGTLSGGERNRVHLAMMLQTGGNLLLLDEPTNDLDVATIRALEEALEEFPGCAVVISHDRWFLDRMATHILAFEGDSQVEWFEGNYADYERDRKRRLGHDADQPHRIKYKPLQRK